MKAKSIIDQKLSDQQQTAASVLHISKSYKIVISETKQKSHSSYTFLVSSNECAINKTSVYWIRLANTMKLNPIIHLTRIIYETV